MGFIGNDELQVHLQYSFNLLFFLWKIFIKNIKDVNCINVPFLQGLYFTQISFCNSQP